MGSIEAAGHSRQIAATAPLIELRSIGKSYQTPAGNFPVLREIDLEIMAGEFVAITGKSGSGKSTLLNLIAGLDSPTKGELMVARTPIHRMAENALARWRGKTIGVVFQFFQLLPTLTTAENVMLPMDFLDARPAKQRRARALELLELVGIADQADKLPAALSGGQQQRAAIARALANDPATVIADEPTGNLDSETARTVLDIFRKLTDLGTTVIVATHERDISAAADRVVGLADGNLLAGFNDASRSTGRVTVS